MRQKKRAGETDAGEVTSQKSDEKNEDKREKKEWSSSHACPRSSRHSSGW